MQRIPLLVLGGVLATAVAAVAVLDMGQRTQRAGTPPRDSSNTRAALSPQSEWGRTEDSAGERDAGPVDKAMAQDETGQAPSSIARAMGRDVSERAAAVTAAKHPIDQDVASTERSAPTTFSSKADAQNRRQDVTVFPEDAEAKIWQVLAANQHLNFTSVDRVQCWPTICEIRFTGGPDLSDSGPLGRLWDPLNNALPMIKSGEASSRVEVSPGIFSSVVTIRSTTGNTVLDQQQPRRP